MGIKWALLIAVVLYIAVWGFIKNRVDTVENLKYEKELKHIADNPVMYFTFYFIALAILNGILGVF